MKYIVILHILTALWAAISQVSVTNEMKREAEEAYRSGDYKTAAQIYRKMIDEYRLEEEEIRLNLANSLFLADEKKTATTEYQILTNSSDHLTRSIAYQQLGVMAALRGKFGPALSHFKQALIIDPANESARYNYELVKKLHDQELSMRQSASRKAPQGPDQENKESRSGEQRRKEAMIRQLNSSGKQQTYSGSKTKGGRLQEENESGDKQDGSGESDLESEEKEKELNPDESGNKEREALKSKRLREIRISEEKARQVLEIMKHEEIQYIQQRRKNEPNREYKNKPDW